ISIGGEARRCITHFGRHSTTPDQHEGYGSMDRSFWKHILRRSLVAIRNSRRARRPKTYRPQVEALEGMVLPSGVTAFPTYQVPHQHALHQNALTPQAGPGAAPAGLSPSQVRHAYGFDQITFANGTVTGDGTGETIAIVDAFDAPNIASDLATFDQQ